MNVLISYDVSTETAAGRKRLRKVAQACQDFGQRVQKSVFECSVSEAQFEEVIRRLLKIIEKTEDSLRIYRLVEPKEKYVQVYGLDGSVNFDEPLVR
ncbi:MAG: CRISPR-associated endonuclease Cas2 [Deltaproteobacteria bacterium]|nr:CRISPR-associated endonuclease Cas2 [Deltaproteobacteria bacterium]